MNEQNQARLPDGQATQETSEIKQPNEIADTQSEPTADVQSEQALPPQTLEELLNSNPTLKKEYLKILDKEKTNAMRTATQKEQQRQKQINAANLTKAERDKLMDDKERAAFYQRMTEELEERISREGEIRELTAEINEILTESKIPAELFNHNLDYFKQSPDEIRERALLFATYDFIPKGELNKLVAEGVKEGLNAKLKQTQPETTQPNKPSTSGELISRVFF
ncbi:MAG: hypothetical protein FWG64_12945 [Firmicutes bacterium]|nr:hypothetical protein [Bacillota bacterium]